MSIYYISETGSVEGPFSNEQIVKLASEKKLTLSTLTANEGDEEWKPLSHYLKRPATPPPPAIKEDEQLFYVHQNNKTTGPYSAMQMEQMRASASLSKEAQITRDGASKWMPYSAFVSGALLGWLASEFFGHHHGIRRYGYNHFDFGTGQTYDYDEPIDDIAAIKASPELQSIDAEHNVAAETSSADVNEVNAVELETDNAVESSSTNADSGDDLGTDVNLETSTPENWPSKSTSDTDLGTATETELESDADTNLGTDSGSESDADFESDSDFDFGDFGGDD